MFDTDRIELGLAVNLQRWLSSPTYIHHVPDDLYPMGSRDMHNT